jgi:hypothetical protein
MRLSSLAIVFVASITLAAGESEPASDSPALDLLEDPRFVEYWLDGRAELTRYDLVQARHGEVHDGDVVLIFEASGLPPDVGENPGAPDKAEPATSPVMKLGFAKRFSTGVKPYSILTSVVTPIGIDADARSPSSVTSVQEWLAQSWLGLELSSDEYEVTHVSTAGADDPTSLEAVWIEDEIWARIRLGPSTLPTGTVRLVPGGEQSLLRERPLAVETARVSLEEVSDGVMVYALRYRNLERKLAIRFEKELPHAILGWEEWYRDPLGYGAESQTTRATRAESIRLDYRNRTGKDDAAWRKKLGLD